MNDRPELERSWTKTRGHLDRAAVLLPPGPLQSEQGGRLDRYREWLDHNELELALDELEGLGENNAMRSSFWIHLRSAAQEMRLDEHSLRIEKRLAGMAG